MATGKWSVVLNGAARIPSMLPPLDIHGDVAGDESEAAYCADLVRRMVEFELDPVNFFKMPRSGSR